jgi:hypothetical protein
MGSSYNAPSTKFLYRGTQIVWYIIGLIEIMLAFRFILKLMGANATATFTEAVYTLSHPLVTPFGTVFNTTNISNTTFEWTTLLAMFVYLIISYGIVKIFLISKTVSTPEAAIELSRQE